MTLARMVLLSLLASASAASYPLRVAARSEVPIASTLPSTSPSTQPINVEALIADLGDEDVAVRQNAEDRLVQTGLSVCPRLEKLLSESADNETRVRVRSALQRLEFRRRTEPTLVTLHLNEAPLEQAAAELSKQSELRVDPVGKNWRFVSVDATDQPFWKVMQELCSSAGARPQMEVAVGRIQLLPDAGWAKKSARVSGGCLVVLDAVERWQEAPDPAEPGRGFMVRWNVFPDPAFRPLTFLRFVEKNQRHFIRLTEAKDEHGQSLIGEKRPGSVGSGSGSYSFETVLRQPKWQPGVKGSTRIATLAGEVGLVLQARTAPIRIPDILNAKEISRTAGGVKLTVHSTQAVLDGFTMDVTLQRTGKYDDRVWEAARQLFPPLSPQLINAEKPGARWVLTRPTVNGAEDRLEAALTFTDENAAGIKPAELALDVPVALQDQKVPVFATDVVLP